MFKIAALILLSLVTGCVAPAATASATCEKLDLSATDLIVAVRPSPSAEPIIVQVSASTSKAAPCLIGEYRPQPGGLTCPICE